MHRHMSDTLKTTTVVIMMTGFATLLLYVVCSVLPVAAAQRLCADGSWFSDLEVRLGTEVSGCFWM